MRRILSVMVLTSFLAFAAVQAAMGAGLAPAGRGGSMEASFSCLTASCPASGDDGMKTVDCIGHCLSVTASEFPASPILPALFVFAFALLLAVQSLFPLVEDRARRFTDVIGRLLLRQRLATVVLRN